MKWFKLILQGSFLLVCVRYSSAAIKSLPDEYTAAYAAEGKAALKAEIERDGLRVISAYSAYAPVKEVCHLKAHQAATSCGKCAEENCQRRAKQVCKLTMPERAPNCTEIRTDPSFFCLHYAQPSICPSCRDPLSDNCLRCARGRCGKSYEAKCPKTATKPSLMKESVKFEEEIRAEIRDMHAELIKGIEGVGEDIENYFHDQHPRILTDVDGDFKSSIDVYENIIIGIDADSLKEVGQAVNDVIFDPLGNSSIQIEPTDGENISKEKGAVGPEKRKRSIRFGIGKKGVTFGTNLGVVNFKGTAKNLRNYNLNAGTRWGILKVGGQVKSVNGRRSYQLNAGVGTKRLGLGGSVNFANGRRTYGVNVRVGRFSWNRRFGRSVKAALLRRRKRTILLPSNDPNRDASEIEYTVNEVLKSMSGKRRKREVKPDSGPSCEDIQSSARDACTYYSDSCSTCGFDPVSDCVGWQDSAANLAAARQSRQWVSSATNKNYSVILAKFNTDNTGSERGTFKAIAVVAHLFGKEYEITMGDEMNPRKAKDMGPAIALAVAAKARAVAAAENGGTD